MAGLPDSVFELAELVPAEDLVLDIVRTALPDVQVQSAIRLNQTFPLILIRRLPTFVGFRSDERFTTSYDIAVHAYVEDPNGDEDAGILSEAVRVALRDAWLNHYYNPALGSVSKFEVMSPPRRVTDWATASGPVQFADLPNNVHRYEARYQLGVRKPRAKPYATGVEAMPAPGATVLSAGDPTETAVTLSWTAATDATGYTLQRGTTTIYTGPLLTFADTGRTAGATYTYRVRATGPGGNGPWSNVVTVTMDSPPPPPEESDPVSLWSSAFPTGATHNGDGGVNFATGTQMSANVPGTVTHVRFLGLGSLGGTIQGELYSMTNGTTGASAGVTGSVSSASYTQGDWVELELTGGGVHVEAGEQFVTAIRSSTGRYWAQAGVLSTPVTSGPLTAHAHGSTVTYLSGSGAAINGRFGTGTAMPTSSFGAAAYYVDVVFVPDPA